jgi:hypothetical protein|tara:strand:- start:1397 stop:2005 length:609 start_codon:yes stop_codon:yes gene_type:complete
MKTAWFNKSILPNAMINSGFKPLHQSDHFDALDKCFKMTEGDSLLDLGCGIAEAGSTFTDYSYTGADLPHIIDQGARKKNPDLDFIHFEAGEDNYDFVGKYDIVLMNSFISEVPDWYRILSHVLLSAKKYIIIHRQEVTNEPSFLEEYKTYANLMTIKTVINYDDLAVLFERSGYEVKLEVDSFPYDSGQKTFLLKRIEEGE